jgi:hypothetical protein
MVTPDDGLSLLLQEWEEVLGNTDLYPKKLPGITLAKGDKLFIDWDEPVHLVAVYDRSNASRLVPTVPYPPQPIYKCPNCEYLRASLCMIDILPTSCVHLITDRAMVMPLLLPRPVVQECIAYPSGKGVLCVMIILLTLHSCACVRNREHECCRRLQATSRRDPAGE